MQYQFEGFELDTESDTLLKGGEPVELKGVGLTFLTELVKAAPDALTPDELAQRVWNRDTITTPTIKKRIAAIHEALGLALIEDVREGSYALTVSVRSAGPVDEPIIETDPEPQSVEQEPALAEPEVRQSDPVDAGSVPSEDAAERQNADAPSQSRPPMFEPDTPLASGAEEREGADPAELMRRAMIVGGVFMALVLISLVLQII